MIETNTYMGLNSSIPLTRRCGDVRVGNEIEHKARFWRVSGPQSLITERQRYKGGRKRSGNEKRCVYEVCMRREREENDDWVMR